MEMANPVVMITLVGEQPIPTLIPTLFLRPEEVILVRTDNKQVKEVSENLMKLISHAEPMDVSPCDIQAISELRELVQSRGWGVNNLLFNLNGGTKPMAFAAYCLAEQVGSSFVYLQSGGCSTSIRSTTLRGIPLREAESIQFSSMLIRFSTLMETKRSVQNGTAAFERTTEGLRGIHA